MYQYVSEHSQCGLKKRVAKPKDEVMRSLNTRRAIQYNKIVKPREKMREFKVCNRREVVQAFSLIVKGSRQDSISHQRLWVPYLTLDYNLLSVETLEGSSGRSSDWVSATRLFAILDTAFSPVHSQLSQAFKKGTSGWQGSLSRSPSFPLTTPLQ